MSLGLVKPKISLLWNHPKSVFACIKMENPWKITDKMDVKEDAFKESKYN
jgi:hypothetical protein